MQLGEKQLLKVVKKVEFGVYLGEEDSEESPASDKAGS